MTSQATTAEAGGPIHTHPPLPLQSFQLTNSRGSLRQAQTGSRGARCHEDGEKEEALQRVDHATGSGSRRSD